ncbi:TonB-dependent receptor [Chitinophaga niabensis]|uniref:SusC/RagA family TonB-linked outer membrane protein n=1 Tax=Chitinophaga niabensis TaxID=536979 RepID=UPI0031BABC39
MRCNQKRKILHRRIFVPVMVFFAVFLLSGAMALPCHAQQIDEVRISLKGGGRTVVEVLDEIQQKSAFQFVYDPKQINGNNIKIHQSFRNATVKSVLDSLRLTSQVNGKNVLLTRASASAPGAEKIRIKGIVKDSRGTLLPGVLVQEMGTENAQVTNATGAYEIMADAGGTLLFKMMRYAESVIPVEGRSIINITLQDAAKQLDEAVVVGFGTQKKYSVVGAITTIQPEELQMSTSRSLSSNLAGQLSGIIATQRSGEPGYDNASFWIRGISTFAGSRSPLVLVDGVERSLNNIDPAEIESFSILKDAAASAVYGVRGANGVIIINTKRGHIGKPAMNIRMEQGFTQPVKIPDFLGAADYLEVLNGIARESGGQIPYTQEQIDNIRNKVDPDLYPDVNWLDAITNNHASNTRVNLTVSGGSDFLRYAFVGSYYGENGIMSRDETQSWNSSLKLKRYNMRTNIDLKLTPSTLMRVNLGGYLQDGNRAPQSIDDLFSRAFEIPPYVHPARYSSGEIPVTPERSNPWALATQTGYDRSSTSKLESLFAIEQNLDALTEGLKANVKFSFDRYSGNSVRRSKTPDYYNPATARLPDGSLDLVIYKYGEQFLGYSTGSEWGDKSVYLEASLNYSRNFGRHYTDALFLYNQRNYDNGDRLPFRNQGIAGRFSYAFDHRYIAEFNFGYNGSENFARGRRFGFFPSVAIGWLISEEPFMKRFNNTISKLKVRGSYGLVGNDRIDGRRFAYITTIGDTDGYSWGIDADYGRAGRREGDYGVENLTWETVTKTNVGIELGLFNSIELRVDLFDELRRDIFMQRKTIPGSAGFIQTPWANFGKVNNRGLDMSLDIKRQFNSNFFLSVRGNLTYAVNKILEQDEPATVIGTNRSSTGKPVGQIFGLVAEGLFSEADFEDVDNGVLNKSIPAHTYGLVRPGDIKYKDLNGDGFINDFDRTAIGGTVDPQIVYGFGLNARYRQFDIGLFFQGNAKTQRVIGEGTTYFIPGSGSGALGNIYANVEDRWTKENPRQDVFWPRLSNSVHANNTQASTWWLRDMSMIRLRNLELGYNFRTYHFGKVKMDNARLFIRGNNLFVLSSFDLWDPELGSSNGFRYPIMKSLSVGLNANF